MAEQEEWSSNANEAIDISLVQAGDKAPKTLSTFHPQFTYPIFGDEEQIFGYQGLRINLRFAAHDLRPNIEISYDKKFKAVGDTKATDIDGILKEWTPEESFTKSTTFNAAIQDDAAAADFKPPGELLEHYTSKGRNFEIWCGELTDTAVQKIIERMQILISFFIEGGTPLTLDDAEWTLARWRVFFVYEKLSNPPSSNASQYSIVGYSTSYRFLTFVPSSTPSKPSQKPPLHDFTLPPPTPISPSTLPSRARISQFLILPSHQHHSHGTHLYASMAKTFLSSPYCTEITVEDPNESFDDLRDYCDYTHLLSNGTLDLISLNTDLSPKLTAKRIGIRVPTSSLLDIPLLTRLRKRNKLAPRQFSRLVEMHLLAKIAPHARQAGTARLTQRARATDKDDRAFWYWRLLVKQRVYKKNRDVLMQLDRVERVEKVEQTVGEVVGDYERLLRRMAERALRGEVEDGVRKKERAKRKVVQDEEDDDEVMLDVPTAGGDARKRRKEG